MKTNIRAATNVSHFFFVALRPNAGHGLLILEVSRSHTTTHHSRQDSYGRVISSSQRPLPDNTQHSQQINFHVPAWIRTHDLSRLAAVDLCLRPLGPATNVSYSTQILGTHLLTLRDRTNILLLTEPNPTDNVGLNFTFYILYSNML